jgi:hypothetical protein
VRHAIAAPQKLSAAQSVGGVVPDGRAKKGTGGRVGVLFFFFLKNLTRGVRKGGPFLLREAC